MPVYSLHIQFDDGSPPYAKHNLTAEEMIAEKEKWNKRYILVQIDGSMASSFFYFRAYRRKRVSR